MILIDIHAHLDFPEMEKELDNIIERARSAGVKTIIANSVAHKSMRKTLEIAEKYDIVKAALGLYPLDALEKESGKTNQTNLENLEEDLKFIEQNKEKIIAIGEIGIDLHNGKDLETQKIIFKKQLELAKKLNIPAIIHTRKAEEIVLDILEEFNYKKIVLHCFSGKKRLIKRASELGYSFSVPTCIVRAENFQELVKEVDINQLLTETDSPFLSPFKDKTNEPSFIIEAVKKIAEIKGFTVEETANTIWMNYQRLFL